MRDLNSLEFPSDRAKVTSTTEGISRLRSETLLKFNRDQVSSAYKHDGPFHLDLSAYTILSPDGLVAALALLLYRESYGRRPNFVTLPSDATAVGKLEKLGFLHQLLKTGAQITNEWVIPSASSVQPPPTRALACIQGISGGSIRAILEEIPKDFLDRELPRMNVERTSDLGEKAGAFCEMLGEIVHNVHKHTNELRHERGIETVGFACYADWPARYPLFRFACSDIGPGLEATLKKKQVLSKSGPGSIAAALLYRRLYPDSKLIGLYDSLSFLMTFQGRLYISSEEGEFTLDLSSEAKRDYFAASYRELDVSSLRQVARFSESDSLPGVHVYVDLWLPRQEVRRRNSSREVRWRTSRAFR